jgi:prepilin peptidase CpaA
MGVRGAGFALLNISLGVIVGGGIAIALWRVGAFGGGDVKFLAAVGAYVGPLFTLQLTAYSLLLFVLTSLLVFARNKRLSSALSASVAFMFKQRRERAEPLPAFELVPFGPAAFVGVCITALGTLNS